MSNVKKFSDLIDRAMDHLGEPADIPAALRELEDASRILTGNDRGLPAVLTKGFRYDTSILKSAKGTTRTERILAMLSAKKTGKAHTPWRVVNTDTNKVVTTDTKAVCKEAAYKLNTARLGDKQDICYLAERIPCIPEPLDKDGASFTLTTYEEGDRFVVISEIAAMEVVTQVHDSLLGITERQTMVLTKAGCEIRFSESAYDLLRTSIQKGGTQ